MVSFFARYWKTLALTSVSLTSSYFFSHFEHPQANSRALSLLKLYAAEVEKPNTGKSFLKNQKIEQINIDEDDDEDDEDGIEQVKEEVFSIREKRFRDFASMEYKGEIYMSSGDLIESVITLQPRPRIGRRQLTDQMVASVLKKTPSKQRGSKQFFRSLDDSLISLSDYLFLGTILSKPANQFGLAFAMFDTNGNQVVDREEFLVLERIISQKRLSSLRSKIRFSSESEATSSLNTYFKLNSLINRLLSNSNEELKIRTSVGAGSIDTKELISTTLLIHLFGKDGRDKLNFQEFQRFTTNFQTEILEIEFIEFSHGFKTISDLDFAEVILRHTNFDHRTKKSILNKIKTSIKETNTITFEDFQQFFTFLNNVEEFNIAMRFHQLSNKPISQAEFQRAVKISSGSELNAHIVSLIFRLFDTDTDEHLNYNEFAVVVKDRFYRGFQSFNYQDRPSSKFNQFKRCLRTRVNNEARRQQQTSKSVAIHSTEKSIMTEPQNFPLLSADNLSNQIFTAANRTVSCDILENALKLHGPTLLSKYPPRYGNKSKRALLQDVFNNKKYTPAEQYLLLTRFYPQALPSVYTAEEHNNPTKQFKLIHSVFDYRPTDPSNTVDWYMNFANHDIFSYYYTDLLAQDELQVLECPHLASIREYLVKQSVDNQLATNGKVFNTYVMTNDVPYPILISNVERVIDLDTTHLYGNKFAAADPATVLNGYKYLNPSQSINIVAIEAPKYGHGEYTPNQIKYILQACFTAYSAVKLLANITYEMKTDKQQAPTDLKTNIHTGWFGCGAYGGNRTLMIVLQILAARMAAVDILSFYTVVNDCQREINAATAYLAGLFDKEANEFTIDELITKIVSANFQWGSSNGT